MSRPPADHPFRHGRWYRPDVPGRSGRLQPSTEAQRAAWREAKRLAKARFLAEREENE